MVARSTGRRRCTGLLPRTVKILAEAPGSVVSEAGSYRVSAAGLLGEQPLVTWNNVGKGTRQTRSVTSGQGLALRIEAGLVGRPQCLRAGGLRLRSESARRDRGRVTPDAGQTRRQAGNRSDIASGDPAGVSRGRRGRPTPGGYRELALRRSARSGGARLSSPKRSASALHGAGRAIDDRANKPWSCSELFSDPGNPTV